MMKIPVIAVIGPTASGKTALSVKLAQQLSGEIISADSMQIYRGLDIATAKPTEEEKQGIPHHLMDFLDPGESFSVARFCELAHPLIRDIHARGKLPIVVGGTGLYVDSLLCGMSFFEVEPDPGLRAALQRELEEKGMDVLLGEIAAVDPEAAVQLSAERNPKHIIRALEVYRATGMTRTKQNELQKAAESPYHTLKIGLTADDRDYLYQRINARVDAMMEAGLLQEAQRFYRSGFGATAAAAIGYKELKPYLDGALSLDTCVENLKRATRRYAKRQLTWFRRDTTIHWLSIDRLTDQEILERSLDFVKKGSIS